MLLSRARRAASDTPPALRLASADTHVLALARTVGGLEDLDDAIKAKGGSATLVPLDITDDAGLERLGLSIHQRWGRLDAWVHAAGHAPPLAPAPMIAEKDLDRAHAVNGRATQRLIVMLDPLLRAAPDGRVVHVDDDPGPQKFFAAYRASKLSARAAMEAWAAESARTGPHISIFRPEPMPTALRARFFPGENTEKLASTTEQAERLVAVLEP